MSAKDKFVDMKKRMKEAQKEMERVAKDAFKEGCKELFDENPELKSFGWRQYTPYWADGEIPEFSAHIDYCYVNSRNSYGEDLDDDSSDVVETSIEHRSLCKKVSNFLRMLEQSDYKIIFGDHVFVEVTRDKVKTTEYEHD